VPSNHKVHPQAKPLQCQLQGAGWNALVRSKLEDLIRNGSGRRLPVVFDFDNTIICGDVSDVTIAVLTKSGLVSANRLPQTFSPPFRAPGKPRITLEACADITEYYDAFLAPSLHGKPDPSLIANGYVWAVEVMEGLRPLDVVQATRTACEGVESAEQVFIELTSRNTAYPVPFFYPEIVELIAELLRHRFDIWLVSAGNVWSMRWMVLELLNPKLRRLGARKGLRSDHLLGVSTLLADREDRLHRDAALVRQHRGYAALDKRALAAFRLTSRLDFPVPTYTGKLACVFDAIGQKPYLCVGDSSGDHSMMAISEHRLWIARLERPDQQRATLDFVRLRGGTGWMVQPTLTRKAPGFIAQLSQISGRLGRVPPEVNTSRRILTRLRSVLSQARNGQLEPDWLGTSRHFDQVREK
jgi:hypothetical protein